MAKPNSHAGWIASVSLGATLLFMAGAAGAQSLSTGTIGGVVKDASGAVLPGVTVEAASPVLIEKVRSVVSDSQGLYKIVDLRPGNYTVTFSLAGFNTLRREGIELTTGFTATVNGDLTVGNLEETVTVSGAAPTVDTQNVTQRLVFARATTDNLPVGQTLNVYASLIPGAVYNSGASSQDVGGSKGEFVQGFTVHGGRANDFQQLRDGMFFGTLVAAGNRMTSLNPATVQEVTVQTSGVTAESESGGTLINVVPRDGGNAYSGTFNTVVADRSLQSDNLDDALRARGLTQAPFIRKRYDVGGGLGGPLMRDTLWFFGSTRSWVTSEYQPGNYYNKTQGTLFYTPDLDRPAYDNNYYKEARLRLTWQATPKDKISAMFGNEWNCNCPNNITGGTRAPEATADALYVPDWNAQVTWSRPATNRLLFEAGSVVVNGKIQLGRTGAALNDPAVLDSSRNYGYGNLGWSLGLTGSWGNQSFFQTNERFAVSYVTGSHALKAGVQYMWGRKSTFLDVDPGLNETSYTFTGTTPQSVTQLAGPISDLEYMRTLGTYLQDQWTISRLTLNLGLRFDYLNGNVPAQQLPAGTFVPARSFAAVDNVPNWKDWNPRLGGAYDLFGNGKTALKAFLGRYVLFEPIGGMPTLNNPSQQIVTSATRLWGDANSNYVPDCDLHNLTNNGECGPISNTAFGQVVQNTIYDSTILTGNRQYSWQTAFQVQHELTAGISLNVGYFRTWYGNFRVVDNRAVTAADFTSYCITAPTNAALPSGGGYPVCGLYDVAPSKFGLTNNVVTLADAYGKQTDVFNGIDVTMNARFGGGGIAQAGFSTGSEVTDNCFQNNQPNILSQFIGVTAAPATVAPRTQDFCHNSPPWGAALAQFKASVIYPLPWKLQASANYQNTPGIPTVSSLLAPNALIAPALGRNLAACGTRVPCTSTVLIDLIPPNVFFQEPRINQLDLRFSRNFLWKTFRLQPQFDIFNVTNKNSVLTINTRYGPSWRYATAVLAPRVLRVGLAVNF